MYHFSLSTFIVLILTENHAIELDFWSDKNVAASQFSHDDHTTLLYQKSKLYSIFCHLSSLTSYLSHLNSVMIIRFSFTRDRNDFNFFKLVGNPTNTRDKFELWHIISEVSVT